MCQIRSEWPFKTQFSVSISGCPESLCATFVQPQGKGWHTLIVKILLLMDEEGVFLGLYHPLNKKQYLLPKN